MSTPVYDGGAVTGVNYGQSSSAQWVHAVPNESYRILLIPIVINYGAGTMYHVDSVSCEGPSNTRTGKYVTKQIDSDSTFATELWFVTNPDVGNNTITVGFSDNLLRSVKCVGYYNADQSDDPATTFTAYGSATNGLSSITKAIASADTDLGLSFIGISGSDPCDPYTVGETQRIDYDASFSIDSAEMAGSSSGITMGWKNLAAYYNMLIVASLKGITGGNNINPAGSIVPTGALSKQVTLIL